LFRWVRHDTGCATVGGAYPANSFAEAVQGAPSLFGGAVIEAPVEPYTFPWLVPWVVVRGQFFMSPDSKDADDASACAQVQCINCGEPTSGSCL
jgi:hypothetical protein